MRPLIRYVVTIYCFALFGTLLFVHWWTGRALAGMTSLPLIIGGIAGLSTASDSSGFHFTPPRKKLSPENVMAGLCLAISVLIYLVFWLIFGSTLSLGGHLMGWGFLLIGTAIGRFR